MKRAGGGARGWSLVELMVGMAISMVGISLMLDSAVRFEPQKRATASGANAVNDGAYAMYWLTREIQQSGYGIVTTPSSAAPGTLGTAGVPTIVGCFARYNYNNNGRIMRNTVRLAPVLVEDRLGDGSPDAITVVYGSADVLSTPVAISAPIASASQTLPTTSNVGFHVGDLLALVDMSAAKHAANPRTSCALVQVSGPSAGGRLGEPVNPTGALERAYSVAFPFNAAPGMTDFTAQTRLVNLGQQPQVIRYSIERRGDQSRLIGVDVLRDWRTPSVIAEGVIDMQAQYGIDTDNDDRVDAWVEPTGDWSVDVLSPLRIAQIKAVRLALLVRASQDQTPASGAPCDASSLDAAHQPLLPASANPPMPSSGTPLNAVNDPRYRCYQYKTFRATVSVRNMVWSNL